VKAILKFAFQLGVRFNLTDHLIVKKDGRFFLMDENLLKIVRKNFYYAGTYLGKSKNGKFFPSFNLLAMLAKFQANKIVVDSRSAWLFICGRDVFYSGIVCARGLQSKGDHTLVLNEYGECLGFGRLMGGLCDAGDKKVAVKNVLDLGDFLRRES
jgi:ribosome biogenesis protein Nip4